MDVTFVPNLIKIRPAVLYLKLRTDGLHHQPYVPLYYEHNEENVLRI
jgi:hypothetical protein